MAKIIITGTAASLKSAVKMADLKKLANASPKALVMFDQDKNEVFRIEVDSKKPGSIGKFGVSFDKKDKAGFAMVTVSGTDFENMTPDALAEHFMPALLPLNDLEDHIINRVLPNFKARVAEAAALIEVAGETEVVADTEAPAEVENTPVQE